MPLSDWLNAVILQQAVMQGIRVPPFARGVDERTPPDHPGGLNQRLDELSRRIDQVARSATAAYAPKRGREESDHAEPFVRLEQHSNEFATNMSQQSTRQARENTYPPALADRIAEITSRRRSLNGDTVPTQPQQPTQDAPQPGTLSAHDLSGLESQLRHITDQIETLRRPGAEEAIAAFRMELGEIGRTLNEALPRRAIEAIEVQIQKLGERISDERQAGIDGNDLVRIEHGLSKVFDALRALTPAENLVGYTEAIDALARKIDHIIAQQDPALIRQLENSIDNLREIATHVASNETMSSLSAQVQALADKVDHLAIGGRDGDALNRLELRIDALSRALSDRLENGEAMPSRLEALIQSLSEKIEQLHQSRGGQIAIDHLEDRIAKLFERLNATDSRLNHLDAIERGLTDLLVHIEDIRANKEKAGLRSDNGPDFDLPKQEMARTQNSLATVNGTLDRVAERLDMVESGIRAIREAPSISETDASALAQSADKFVAQSIPASAETGSRPLPNPPLPTSVPSLSADFSNSGLHPKTPVTSEPGPFVDQPLEPGSGRPAPATSPGLRIAASEVALGGVRPTTAAANGKSNFIAAARRAAQAAGQDLKGRPVRPEPLKTTSGETRSLRIKVMTRVKTLFLAASIVAIIIGSIQFASNIFDFRLFDTREAKFAAGSETDTAQDAIVADTGDSETATARIESQPPSAAKDADLTASLLAPPDLPSPAPVAQPAPAVAPAVAPQAQLNTNPADQSWLIPNLPALSAPPSDTAPAPKSDVTGSIARTPADSRSNRPPAQAAQPLSVDGLPAAIGGARLRNAALAGDPAAAYEIGTRFIEGRGVPANLQEAARWYERAASKGLTPAQFRYASMLEKGQGVKKDLAAAQKLYVAAAGKGHAKAMHNLAVLYAEGFEGKPDYANAAQWFRKAAERGVPDSQFNLGVLTARGLGTEKNLAESYKWFALAAAQGDRDAGRKRDEVATYLNAEAVSAAEEAVKSFTPRSQPAEATVVQPPPGGWDRSPSQQEKPRTSRPLSVSASNAGKL